MLWAGGLNVTEPVFFQFGNATVAEGYERFLVPRIFAPWADALLEALDLREGERVLDVACGPGTVAKAAAMRVGARGEVVGADASEEMLTIARESTPASARARYEFALADALPFPDASFDVLTCQQGLQFFSDRPKALAEMFRVLRPGGRAGIATWSSIADSPYFAAVQEALGPVLPDAAAAIGKPFAMFDANVLATELAAAGFEAVVDSFSLPLVFDGMEQAVEAIRGMPVWPSIVATSASDRTAIFESAREGFTPFLHHGRVQTAMRSNVAVARRPG